MHSITSTDVPRIFKPGEMSLGGWTCAGALLYAIPMQTGEGSVCEGSVWKGNANSRNLDETRPLLLRKLLCIPLLATLFFFRQCTETVTVITSGPGGTVRSSSVQFDFTASSATSRSCGNVLLYMLFGLGLLGAPFYLRRRRRSLAQNQGPILPLE